MNELEIKQKRNRFLIELGLYIMVLVVCYLITPRTLATDTWIRLSLLLCTTLCWHVGIEQLCSVASSVANWQCWLCTEGCWESQAYTLTTFVSRGFSGESYYTAKSVLDVVTTEHNGNRISDVQTETEVPAMAMKPTLASAPKR